MFLARQRGFHTPPAFAAFHHQKDTNASFPLPLPQHQTTPHRICNIVPSKIGFATQRAPYFIHLSGGGKHRRWKRSLVVFSRFINTLFHQNDFVPNLKKGNKKTGLQISIWSLAHLISSTGHSHFQHAAENVSLPSTKRNIKMHQVVQGEPAFQIPPNL